MEIMGIKDEKQFKDTVTTSINMLKPKLAEIFGTGHPAIQGIVNDIFNKATAVHKERYQPKE